MVAQSGNGGSGKTGHPTREPTQASRPISIQAQVADRFGAGPRRVARGRALSTIAGCALSDHCSMQSKLRNPRHVLGGKIDSVQVAGPRIWRPSPHTPNTPSAADVQLLQLASALVPPRWTSGVRFASGRSGAAARGARRISRGATAGAGRTAGARGATARTCCATAGPGRPARPARVTTASRCAARARAAARSRRAAASPGGSGVASSSAAAVAIGAGVGTRIFIDGADDVAAARSERPEKSRDR
jgi:hypothetical protein